MDLSTLLKEFRTSTGETAEKQAKDRIQMGDIKTRLQAGETSGDPITDVVFLRYSGDMELETSLHNLQEKLQQHLGELVLVEERYVHHESEPACFGGVHSNNYASFSFARIAEPFLRFQEREDGGLAAKYYQDGQLVVTSPVIMQGLVCTDNTNFFFGVSKLQVCEEDFLPFIPILLHPQAERLYPSLDYLFRNRVKSINSERESGMLASLDDLTFRSGEVSFGTYVIHIGNAEVDARFEETRLLSRGERHERLDLYPVIKRLVLEDQFRDAYLEEKTGRNKILQREKKKDLALRIFDLHYTLEVGKERALLSDHDRLTYTDNLKILLQEANDLGMQNSSMKVRPAQYPGMTLEVPKMVNDLTKKYMPRAKR